MGMIRDAISAVEKQQDETSKQVESNLHLLQELSQAKLADMISKTDKRISETNTNHEIPAGFKMFEASEMRVLSSSGPAAGISEALDGLLTDPEKKWRDSVSHLVSGAVNTLLGQARGAAVEKQYYLIALDGHAATASDPETYTPVRIDYCLWVYDLQSSGVVEQATHAMAYHARKSLLDYENCPKEVQIRQSMKLIGTPPDLIDQTVQMIRKDQKENGPANLPAYADSLAPAERQILQAAKLV